MTATELVAGGRSAEPDVAPLTPVLRRGRVRRAIAMLGPAFVAAMAYVDPGNFATNISAGSQYGYALVWVVVLANLMAMPVQYCSAKIGIVTGRSLPEVCATRYGKPVRWLLWAQAELVAMATDLAEFLGAAIGLNLLFGLPMMAAGLVTAVAAFVVLGLQSRGYRPFERAIVALLLLVMGGFAYQLLDIGPSVSDAAGGLLPSLPGTDAVFLTVGIIGATVMPHVVYLHSALTSNRLRPADDSERRRALRFERWDVRIALGLAGVINLTMLVVAAKLFHGSGTAVDSIELAHSEFGRLAGGGAALAFAVALLASGVASSSVGTYAGQVVMAGFIRVRIPILVRRLATMLPSLAVLWIGWNTTDVLNLSQVCLSFGIPFALIPLIAICRDRRVMGTFVNPRWLTAVMVGIAALIIGLNGVLIVSQFA